MRVQHLALLPLALLAAPTATAQVFALPPFEGEQQEGFETQVGAGMDGWQDCLVGDAFEGNLQICAPLGPHMHVTTSWSFDCTATPKAGDYLAGVRSGSYMLFTFLVPVDRIGGYWASNAPDAGTVTVYFYDQVFQPLGEQVLDLSADCEWRWNGWESQGGPVYFMEVVNDLYSGGRILMDELTADLADDSVGKRYCDVVPNSTGMPALLTASGTTSIAADDLVLTAYPVPARSQAILFYGPEPVSVPYASGTRCVGDQRVGVQRYTTSGASALGEVVYEFDYSETSFLPVTAGSTYYFQTWFADPADPSGVGLSDALELVFVP